jgi:hypothetical protein
VTTRVTVCPRCGALVSVQLGEQGQCSICRYVIPAVTAREIVRCRCGAAHEKGKRCWHCGYLEGVDDGSE